MNVVEWLYKEILIFMILNIIQINDIKYYKLNKWYFYN